MITSSINTKMNSQKSIVDLLSKHLFCCNEG